MLQSLSFPAVGCNVMGWLAAPSIAVQSFRAAAIPCVLPADDKLKKLFPGTKCSMFKLQKHLSKHCKTSGEAGSPACRVVVPAYGI